MTLEPPGANLRDIIQFQCELLHPWARVRRKAASLWPNVDMERDRNLKLKKMPVIKVGAVDLDIVLVIANIFVIMSASDAVDGSSTGT